MPRGILRLPFMGFQVAYLLRDQFTTAQSAPLLSPRACEPGPGGLTLTQTTAQFSISGGQLQIAQPASPTQTGYGAVGTVARTRRAGLAIYANILKNETTTYHPYIGFANAAAIPAAIAQSEVALAFGTPAIIYEKNALTVGAYASGTQYEFLIILGSSGGRDKLLIRGGAYTSWTLLWVGVSGTNTSLYELMVDYGGSGTLDDFTSIYLTGPWASDYGVAVSRVITPTTGETVVGSADGQDEFTWTPASAEAIDFQFRRTDDNNCWIVRCDQAAGTIKLFDKQASVETEHDAGKTQTWTVSTAYRISVLHYGATIKTVVNATAKNSITDGTYGQTATGVKVTGFTTGANLACWPRSVVLPSPFV